MTNKEILALQLENAYLKRSNINLQGLLLSKDLKDVEQEVLALEVAYNRPEEPVDAQVPDKVS